MLHGEVTNKKMLNANIERVKKAIFIGVAHNKICKKIFFDSYELSQQVW